MNQDLLRKLQQLCRLRSRKNLDKARSNPSDFSRAFYVGRAAVYADLADLLNQSDVERIIELETNDAKSE